MPFLRYFYNPSAITFLGFYLLNLAQKLSKLSVKHLQFILS